MFDDNFPPGNDYSVADCDAAIRRKGVPEALELKVTRLCVVRRIRYYDGFAQHLYGSDPLFTRALNARAIMSNRIPDMKQAEEFPYCIWFPNTVSEATYRQLEACIVADHETAFDRINPEPSDVLIEEARMCTNDHYLEALEAKATNMVVVDEAGSQP